VLQYLTTDAIIETLKGLPPCLAAIGYCLPESDAEWRSEVAAFLRTLAAIGEPFITLTTPHETAELLAAAGFRVLEDLGPGDVAARFGLSCVSPERIALAEKASTGR
jgi:hypothetical protein